jgi:pyruvate dehydrogenase E1 component beta subunit
LVIADGGWKTCGMAAEISAMVSENVFDDLKAPIMRVTLPDAPAPASRTLEKNYYPDFKTIVHAVKAVLRK